MDVRRRGDGDERSWLWRSRWAAIGAAMAVTLGGGGLVAVNAATSAPSSVVTIDPVRILDTRDPVNIGLPGPFISAASQKLKVTGAAVPVGATGVLLNVTVVSPSADGFLSVRPGDATGTPTTSSLNFVAGDIVPNSVQVGLPTAGANAGQIDITYDAFGQTGPTTEVLIDVVGYMVAGDSDARLAALEKAIGDKADASTTYSKAQVDALLAAKLDDSNIKWAIVSTTGVLLRSKGAVSSNRQNLGFFEVVFDDDLSTCSAIASVADMATGEINPGEAIALKNNANLSALYVSMYNSPANLVADRTFTVIVLCP